MSDISKLELGSIIRSQQSRDCIHIPIAPVVAADRFSSGQSVRMVEGKAYRAPKGKGIGVVDPFLVDTVQEGETFWLYLRPGSISGLRHSWDHADFNPEDAPPSKIRFSDAEGFLIEFADRWGMNYETMKDQAVRGDYLVAHGTDVHSWAESGENVETFWDNLEVVTGRKFSASHRAGCQFSCSC